MQCVVKNPQTVKFEVIFFGLISNRVAEQFQEILSFHNFNK